MRYARMRTRNTTWLDFILLLSGAMLIFYVTAYSLMVRRVVAKNVRLGSSANTEYTPQPNFRGLPPGLFQPIHELDRRIFRPKTWASWRVPLWDANAHDPLNPKC